MKRIIGLLLIVLFLSSMISCAAPESSEGDPPKHESTEELFSERDLSGAYDEAEATKITLSDSGTSCENASVILENNCIKLTRGGTYIISGTLNDGQVLINAAKSEKLQIVLSGATITSKTGAPIHIESADKVFLTLEDGTSNSLSTGAQTMSNNADGVIYSRCDLTINGKGALDIESPWAHGIVCKDELVLAGGEYVITSGAHGIDANDSIAIKDATAKITTGKDGIHAENTDDASLGFIVLCGGEFEITAEGDGISAGAYLQIEDGSYNILTAGGYVNGEKHTSDNWGGFPGRPGMVGPPNPGSTTDTDEDTTSSKGIKSVSGILLNGGNYLIDSADDSIHSNCNVKITGGSYTISSGDDAVHADEALTISGGTISISTSYEGLEALNVRVTGGKTTLVAEDDGINAAGGVDSSGFGGSRPGEGFGQSSGSKGSIEISGGELYITASGDGIDANGSLKISGGFTTVTGPTTGDTATLDYDVSAEITGGSFIGTGAAGMAQSFSDSSQGVYAVSMRSGFTAGSEILLSDEAGNIVVRHTPELPFSVVIISTPKIEKGKAYTITIGDSSASFEAS